MKGGYVYIMSNKVRTVLYVGVTGNLSARVQQHKSGMGGIFTAKYKCDDLLYFEFYEGIVEAIAREKNLKNWKREWKEELIKKFNPRLRDLSEEIKDFT
jgi:putative endonuclease